MVVLAVARVNDTQATTNFLPRFRFCDDVESKAFGPAEHMRAVHPPNGQGTGLRRGFVFWGQKIKWIDKKGRERPWKSWSNKVGSEAEFVAKDLIARGKHQTVNNLYFSMQTFRRPTRRGIWNLGALGCFFVDIDYKDTKWGGQDPRIVMNAILAVLDEAGIPAPSFAMDSGNGLHLVWLHTLVLPQALPRWNLVQERLLEALKSFGADPVAKDAARVLRLARSWNPQARDRTRGLVHLVWIQGDEIAKPFRYDFDELADELLPMTRAEIVSLRAERAKRRTEAKPNSRKGGRPAARRDSASYGETVLEDLHRLRKHRYASGRLPPGARDTWLFCAAMALSWITPAPALSGLIETLAEEVSGWRGREARSRMGSIIRRAQDAAAGKSIEYDGKEVDPRYRMKAATIIKWLSIADDEMRAAGLRVLLTPDARRERNVEACRDRRKAKGATSHDEKRAQRIELGRRAMWMHVKDGLKYEEIAAELGVAKATIGKAINEARRASSSTSENASKIGRAAIRHVYGGIFPPKGGRTRTMGSGVQAPRPTKTEKHPPTSGSGTDSPSRKTTAASGCGTGAQAPIAAQRPQSVHWAGSKRKPTHPSTYVDRCDERHAPEPSRPASVSDWVPPRFLRRTG